MSLLVVKLGRSLNFPSRLEDRKAALADFRRKISKFVDQILLKPEPGLEFMSLAWFHKFFDLIHISNSAFAEMVAEIDYPMTEWGCKATEEYLNYTLTLLDLLNSITHSVSHLNRAKLSISHALCLIENSPPSALRNLKKIPRIDPDKHFKPNRVEQVGSATSGKESLVLTCLMVLKKTGFLALGLVLSGLWGDSESYMKIRELAKVSDDSLTSGLDSRFYKESTEANGVAAEVKRVNCAVDLLRGRGKCEEAIKKLKGSLKVMENSMDGIEKEANIMFSEVLATRNKLVDNIRLTGKNH